MIYKKMNTWGYIVLLCNYDAEWLSLCVLLNVDNAKFIINSWSKHQVWDKMAYVTFIFTDMCYCMQPSASQWLLIKGNVIKTSEQWCFILCACCCQHILLEAVFGAFIGPWFDNGVRWTNEIAECWMKTHPHNQRQQLMGKWWIWDWSLCLILQNTSGLLRKKEPNPYSNLIRAQGKRFAKAINMCLHQQQLQQQQQQEQQQKQLQELWQSNQQH